MQTRRMPLDTARRITLAAMFGSGFAVIALSVAIAELGIDLADPIGWLMASPPDQAILGLVLLVTGALAAWLAITTFGYAGARAKRNKLGLFAVTRFTPPVIRRAVDTIAAVSIAVATLGPPSPVSAGTRYQHWNAAVVREFDRSEGPVRIAPPGIDSLGWAPSNGLHDGPNPDHDQPQRHHLVINGENLWRIACEEVKRTTPRPSLHRVASYWLVLIETNRDLLISGDPNLIYPGEQLVLPPVEDIGRKL